MKTRIGPRYAEFLAMRAAVALLVFACSAWGQFKSTAQLVVVPVTVTDPKGHYVDGLTQEDLLLYDNSVPQPVQMDWMTYPISLVVAVQATANSGAVIDKLGGTGILFSQLLAADAGETAILSYSDQVHVRQDFSSDADAVVHSLRMLRKEGPVAHTMDAMLQALQMLEQRPAGRRRILLMIAEKRDRGSAAKLSEVMTRVQQQNVTIYWLTFSPFLQPWTVKPKTKEDLKPEAERIKMKQCAMCPPPDDTPVPPDLGPGGYIYALGELFRLSKPDLSSLFTDTTGGRNLSFLKKSALEHTIQLVGEEVHRQYILNFQPKNTEPGQFHAIRVQVKGRPDLQVTARSGYWALQ
jgi:VWFA-related protein